MIRLFLACVALCLSVTQALALPPGVPNMAPVAAATVTSKGIVQPDNNSTTINAQGLLTTSPGDASGRCPGSADDINSAPPGTTAIGSAWWGPSCGLRINLQNAAGYAVWQPVTMPLPLDAIGYPTTSITVTGAGTGYATGQIVTFAHGVTATVTGGNATNPTLSVTTGGNWPCPTSSSQTGVSQVANTGAGTGAVFTLTTPLPAAYGVKLLTRCYSGSAAALQAVNGVTTETLQTVNFIGGIWDQTTADGYCGLASSATGCAVTTWKDQGGGAYDATQATLANAPIYQNQTAMNGLRPVSFIGSRNGPPTAFTTWLSNAGYPSWNINNFTVLMVGRTANAREARGLFQPVSSTAKTVITGVWNSNGYGSGITNTTATYCPVGPNDNPSIFGIASSGSGGKCVNGNVSATSSYGVNVAVTGITLGTSVLSSSGTAISSDMDLLGAVFFPYTLSTAQLSTLTQALAATFSVPLQYNDVVIWSGDSTGDNGSATNTTFPTKAIAMLRHPAQFINTSVSGATASQLNGQITANECAIYTNLGGARARNFIDASMAGPNDIRTGATSTQVQALLQAYVSAVKSCAPNAKIVIGVPLLQCDMSQNSSWKTALIAVNTWLEANYNVPQSSGGLGADGIADFWREPTIGGYSGTSTLCGFPNSLTSDGQHLTDYGQYFAAGVLATALNAVRR